MAKSFSRQKWEISITLLIYGILTLALAAFLKNSGAEALGKPLPKMTTSSGDFIGNILLVVATVFLGSGLCLVVSGRKFWALLGAAAATSLLVIAVLASVISGSIKLGPLLLALLVVMLWIRVFSFLHTPKSIATTPSKRPR